MPTCTFFGHRNSSYDVKSQVLKQIKILIEQYGVKNFYVGNNGKFDFAVKRILKELQTEDSSIKYNVVLAYMPRKSESFDFADTIFPEGIEFVPKRFSILYRNKWMISHSDFVICHITHEFGGAFSAIEYARKKGKHIVNIAESF